MNILFNSQIKFNNFLFSIQTTPNVYLSHQTFDKNNEWAITPVLIDILQQLIKPKTKWFILCDTNSVINLKSLLIDLDNEDYKTVSKKKLELNFKSLKIEFYFYISLFRKHI